MRVCEVTGTVVAAEQHPAYHGHKVFTVCPVAPDGALQPPSFVAVDNAQAGIGDRVLVLTEGNGVRQILGPNAGPVRSLIVGIVDHMGA